MNVKLLATLTLFGVALGVVSVLGWVGSLEFPLWLLFAVVAAFVIGKTVTGRYFLHGFLAGLFACLASFAIQIGFFETYLMNNPNAAVGFTQLPPTMNPRVVVAVLAPFIAAFTGLVVGGLAALAGKFLGAKGPTTAPTR